MSVVFYVDGDDVVSGCGGGGREASRRRPSAPRRGPRDHRVHLWATNSFGPNFFKFLTKKKRRRSSASQKRKERKRNKCASISLSLAFPGQRKRNEETREKLGIKISQRSPATSSKESSRKPQKTETNLTRR